MNARLLRFNPELARNFRLELTAQRLVLMPVVLFLLTILTISFEDGSVFDDRPNVYDHLASYALIAFTLIAVIWGARNAADGITDEYNGRTWDWQRMSTLSPLRMSIGKLFGATVYNWYGGIICWLIYVFAAMNSRYIGPQIIFISTLNCILTATAIQGFSIITSLYQIRKGDGRSKVKNTPAMVIAILLTGLTFNGFLASGFVRNITSADYYWYGMNLGWYGQLLQPMFFSFWILAGLYRSVRTELQYKNGLKWWVLFLCSIPLFITGYFIRPVSHHISVATVFSAIMAMVTITYFAITFVLVLAEPKEIVNYRSCLKHIRERDFARLYVQAPLWWTSFLFAALSSGLTFMAFYLNGSPSDTDNATTLGSYFWQFLNDLVHMNIAKARWIPLAALGFLTRDILLVLTVNFSSGRKRPDATALILLSVMYFIAPLLARDSNLLFLFFPVNNQGNLPMMLSAWMQTVLMVYYFSLVWKKNSVSG